MAKIGFIGAGNMATAIIKGIIGKNVFNFSDVYISDIDAARTRELKNQLRVNIAADNIALAGMVDVLVLSVKPQVIDNVLAGLAGQLKPDATVVSIAAGIKIEKIEKYLGSLPIVRVMPNTPSLIGFGAAGLYANQQGSSQISNIKRIFSAVGEAIVVDNEQLIDAVTAVSGSGPAYYFLMMEKMIQAAQNLGLSPEDAKKLVLQTAKGAAELAMSGSDSPAELRRKVTSPGGTTQAALEQFEAMGFENMVNTALKAAYDRSEELSR